MANSVDNHNKQILCGFCDTVVKSDREPKPNSRVICPSCGNEDSFKNVMKIVGDGVKENTTIAFGKSLKRSLRGSKFLKFKGRTIHPKKRAFYIDYEIRL